MFWTRRKIGALVVVGVILKVALVVMCWAYLRRHDPLWAFVHSRLTITGGLAIMAALVALLVILGVIRRLAMKPRPDGQSGTATIEMALVFPILLAVVLVMIQSMLVVSGNLAVHLAAFAAARSAIVWIPEWTGAEEWNVVSQPPETSLKFRHIRQAAVLTLTPVSAGKPGAGGANNALVGSQTLVEGIAKYYGQSGQPTPAWINNMLKAKLQYADTFTEVWLDGPANPVMPVTANEDIKFLVPTHSGFFWKTDDGQLFQHPSVPPYGRNEDIRVHVRHRLYLSVPYACRLFGDVLPNSPDYAATVEAAYSLTNQGTIDEMDEEVFPHPAS